MIEQRFLLDYTKEKFARKISLRRERKVVRKNSGMSAMLFG